MALLGASVLSAPLHAQSTQADLKARLKNKPLYLRGRWSNDDLHFDSTGKLIGTTRQTSITLSGFHLDGLHLDGTKLALKGVRVGLELDDDRQKRIDLDETVLIEIDAPSNGDYKPALDAIFTDNLADMVPGLPFYWEKYAEKHFLPTGSLTASQAVSTVPKRPHGSLKPPKLLQAPEPHFTVAARANQYGGRVGVNIWVEPDGSASHLSLIHPIGLGLDENALAAVQKYKFEPSTQDGKPVLVEANIEVRFDVK